MSDITRKQTIKVLESMRKGIRCGEPYIENEEAYQEQIAALDFAIKALEQEPTTKNDLGVDCISRKAVINQIFYSTDNSGDVVLGSALRERIAKLPSVTPQEPKTGHWIANAPQYDMLNPQYICSECGNAHTRTTPYCEMCGAKMIEPQESEDK